MELDTLLQGGAGAGIVWVLLRVIGRWASRQRWHTITETESVTAMAAERDKLRLRIHELELRTATAEAVAKQCRAHMDRQLGVDSGKESIQGK